MELAIPKNPGTIWNGDFHVMLYEDVNFEEDVNSCMIVFTITTPNRIDVQLWLYIMEHRGLFRTYNWANEVSFWAGFQAYYYITVNYKL
jgi:hypothetical protein